MAGSVPLPLKVAAKVITGNSVPVPLLSDDPFKKAGWLEKGIHVHWALPDCLTHGKLVTNRGNNVSVLPGVPDLWLVIRFNPCVAIPPGSPLPPKRMWRAWVVDSVAQTATDLEQWNPPASRDKTKVHTMAGMLPSAASIGYPGYGILAKGEKFDPAMAAYYPESRKRFGFHDKREDLANSNGTVTYAVVGWFSENGWDALYSSPSRVRMLDEWKVAHHVRANTLSEYSIGTMVADAVPTKPAWLPRRAKISEQAAPPAAKLQDVRKAMVRGGTKQSRVSEVTAMKASFPAPKASSNGPVLTTVDHLNFKLGPEFLLLHGAVVEVPLSGSTTAGAKPQDGDVRLYPSLKRAMAKIANSAGTDEQQTDFIEMLLQDVDSQKHSIGGVVDMPGAVHALSFQNVPGKSTWYARIDVHDPDLPVSAAWFDIGAIPFVSSQTASGYWPIMQGRSASSTQASGISSIPSEYRYDPPPAPPDQGALDQFWNDLQNAFLKAKDGALEKDRVLDEKLVFVVDKRKKAKSLDLGRTADGSGTKGAGWWLDISDRFAVDEFRKSMDGSVVHLPDKTNLHEVPGTTWHRPWSPMLVLHGVGRSYRAGFDGRLTLDGYLKTRAAGESLISLSVGKSQRVFAKDFIDSPNRVFSRPGIPSDARLLIQETMLLDPSNSAAMGVMASATGSADTRATLEKQFRSAIRGVWLSRDPKIAASAADKLDAIGLFGEMLDYNATAYWTDPRDPLFIDAKYCYVASEMATGWKLEPEEVEFTRVSGTPTQPQVQEFSERTKVNASIPKILDKTLISRESLNFKGDLITAMNMPDGIEKDTFLKFDVVAAPLVRLDESLTINHIRERSGGLVMKSLELVDIFGIARPWSTNQPPTAVIGNQNFTYWTDLTPRLPYWSRLQFDLRSATDPTKKAGPFASPICGILVPDFIEHALEVFDGDGKAIGQLTTDQMAGKNPGQAMNVSWNLHPWIATALNVPANDLNAIADPKLRVLISTIVQQSGVVGNDPLAYYETGLSAMLRVIDTVRGTLDPSKATPDRRVRLIGEPILVMSATLELQSTAETNPTNLATTEPAPLPPVLPVVKVRIGDVTRPDDGVLGCFLEQEGKFAPVSMMAKEKALLNTLALNLPNFHNTSGSVATIHPFVSDHASEFSLTQNTRTEILLLTDPRGGLYATCGALPRRRIVMERHYIDLAVRNLEPTFQVGPIMTTRRIGSVKPFVPPPQIDGYEAEFVYKDEHPQTHQPIFPETQVAPMPPLGELPNGRAVLSAGWVRIYKSKKAATP
jgi:hypothetical protein